MLMPRLPLSTALLLAAAAAAQETPPVATPTAPDDLQALAVRVDASHHPQGKVEPITAFRGSLELQLVAATAEQGGQIDLLIQFLRWQRPGSTRVRDLITYEVTQAGDPILRGRDRNGFWHLFGGEARDLVGADFANDLAAAERDTSLARQLLQFLDPATVLLGLEKPEPVRDGDLQLGREPKIACKIAAGNLPSFPLLQQAGDDAAVRIEVYVTAAEGRLLALSIWPLVDGRPEPTRGELVRLRDLHERDGVLVPRRVEHYFRNEQGKPTLQSRATVMDLQLRPKLAAEDFDRKTAIEKAKREAQQRRLK